MQSHYEIPDTFWSLFRSVNREIYIESLLCINQEYEYSNYFLTREVCIQVLRDLYMKKQLELKREEDETEFDMLETPSARILNWLIRKGWLKKIEDYILSIPDFPEPGIIFRDITSVLQDADGLQLAIDSMQDCLKDIDVDVIAGTESRGFIFGVPIAYNLHKPFVPIRKKGKLPRETVSVSYDLEYGSAEIEMHKDSIKPGQKVVIVDDLIATGGTIEAAIKLVEQLGGEVVKVVFLMELAGLKGRERLNGYDVASVICYDGK